MATIPYKLRILVIEDNPDNSDLLKILLEKTGYDVHVAIDGKAGLEKAHQIQPDLILLDLALPEMDGWTLAHQLKNDILTQNIPIVAISAHSMKKAQYGALEAGCDAFISKPFSNAAFNKVIKKFLYKSLP